MKWWLKQSKGSLKKHNINPLQKRVVKVTQTWTCGSPHVWLVLVLLLLRLSELNEAK